jgi:hypothetical protein
LADAPCRVVSSSCEFDGWGSVPAPPRLPPPSMPPSVSLWRAARGLILPGLVA